MPAFSWLLGVVAISVTGPAAPAAELPVDESASADSPDVSADPSRAGAISSSRDSAENEANCAQRVVSSCQTALGEEQCALAAPGLSPEWTADVRALPDGVEVTLIGDHLSRTRTLSFAPVDSEEQRCVAAGLLVAAMTAAARLDTLAEVPASSSPSAVKAPVGPRPERKREVSRSQMPAFSIDLGGAAITMLRHDDLGMAASGRGTLWPFLRGRSVAVGISGYVSAGESLGQTSLEVRLLEGGAGLSLYVLPPKLPVGLRVHGEALFSRTWVSKVPQATGTQAANQGGGAARALVVFGRSDLLPWLGVRAALSLPPLEIQREGMSLIEAPLSRFSLGIGLTWQPKQAVW